MGNIAVGKSLKMTFDVIKTFSCTKFKWPGDAITIFFAMRGSRNHCKGGEGGGLTAEKQLQQHYF